MKKILVLLLSIVMIFSSFTMVSADEYDIMPISLDEEPTFVVSAQDNSIKVKQDGTYVDFRDSEGNVVEPQIINGRTMVPFRKIFNSLGVTDENIEWIPETRTVKAKNEKVEIELQIDNTVAKKTVDGITSEITLDSAPVIVDGRTLVPVRFIAESMEKLVGWDSLNRTVVILDTQKLQAELEAAIPEYLEIVSLQTELLSTFDMGANLSGTIKYTDKSDSSNNTNLTFNGTVDIKKSEDALFIEIELKFSGKGAMYEAIKENNLQKLDFTVILKENKMYMNSALFKSMTNGKWLALEDDSIKELFTVLEEAYANPAKASELISVKEEDLTIDTYETLKLTIDMLKAFVGDDKISISGTTTKKYEVEIDLNDIFEFMAQYGFDAEDMEILKKAEMVIGGTVKDGVAKESNVDMVFEISEGNENIKIDLKVESEMKNYNKTVKINVPSEKEIFEVE